MKASLLGEGEKGDAVICLKPCNKAPVLPAVFIH